MPGMLRGHLLQVTTPQKEMHGTIALAHPEGWYLRVPIKLRPEPYLSGEFGLWIQWIKDAALPSLFPHLSLLEQKPIPRVHNKSDNNGPENTFARSSRNKDKWPKSGIYSRCVCDQIGHLSISLTATAPGRHLTCQRRRQPMVTTFASGILDFCYFPPKRYPIVVPLYPKKVRLFDHNDHPPPQGSWL